MMRLSLFRNKTDVTPRPIDNAWPRLIHRVRDPYVRADKDGPLVSPAHYDPPKRGNENVKKISALFFDLDHGVPPIDEVQRRLDPFHCAFAIYSTHSHERKTESNPQAERRLRVFIPLDPVVPPEKFPALREYVIEHTKLPADRAASAPAQMFYLPAKAAPDAPYECVIADGEPLDWTELDLPLHHRPKLQVVQNGNGDVIPQGQRDNTLVSLAGTMRNRGMDCEEITAALKIVNQKRCQPPLPDADVSRIARSVERYEPTANNSVKYVPREEKEPEPIPWPRLDPKALHGLVGEYVKLIGPHTESDSPALVVQFLAAFGNAAGRNPYFVVEADRHYLNLFCALVGETGSGRKGTSMGQVRQRFAAADEDWNRDCFVGGMSSGEGLLYQVRDPIFKSRKNRKTGFTEEEEADSGVTDKRLFVFETELSTVLRASQREGNTLSAMIRAFWDSGTHRSIVKNSPIKTTDAHVSIVGHVVRYELLNLLSECDSVNGFVNRFLWLCAKRSKFLSRGGRTSNLNFNEITEKLKAAVDYAKRTEEMDLTEEAWLLWDSVYMRLETGRTGFLGKVTQRAAPYVRRLACLYALLDRVSVVDVPHLKAALALWQYAEDSARYIFGERTGDKLADEVIEALSAARDSGLTATELSDYFQRNQDSKSIGRALELLLEMGRVESKKEQTGEPGRPTTRWFLISQSNEKNELNTAGGD